MGLVGFESAPRYRELLYKLFSEDLEFPPPGFILELDRPEWQFLKDELRWQTQSTVQAAVAAQFGFAQIFNPPGSGRIITIQGFTASKTALGAMNSALTVTQRGATGGGFAIAVDTRWGGQAAGGLGVVTARDSMVLSFGTSAAFGTDVPLVAYKVDTVAAVSPLLNAVTLGPGTGFLLSDSTLNEAINVAFFGYSRQARPEELVQ